MKKEKFYKEVFELAEKLKEDKKINDEILAEIAAEKAAKEKERRKKLGLEISLKIEATKEKNKIYVIERFEKHFQSTIQSFLKENPDVVFDSQGGINLFKREVSCEFSIVGENIKKDYAKDFTRSILKQYFVENELPCSVPSIRTSPHYFLKIKPLLISSKINLHIDCTIIMDDEYLKKILANGTVIHQRDTLIDNSQEAFARKKPSNML